MGKEGFQKIGFTSRKFGVGSKHYIHTYSDKYFMQAVNLVEIEERAEFLIWLSQCGKGPRECHIQIIPNRTKLPWEFTEMLARPPDFLQFV